MNSDHMKYWIIWATNDRILIVLKRVSSLLLISIINLVLTRFLRQKIYIPCNLACLLIVLLRLPGCFLHRKLKVSKYTLYILTHLFLYVVRIVLKYKIILRKKRHFFLSRTVRSISAFMSANLSNSWKKCMKMVYI